MEYTSFCLINRFWSMKMSNKMLSNNISNELDHNWSESLFESALSAGAHSCAKFSVSLQQLFTQFKVDAMSNYQMQSQFMKLIGI